MEFVGVQLEFSRSLFRSLVTAITQEFSKSSSSSSSSGTKMFIKVYFSKVCFPKSNFSKCIFPKYISQSVLSESVFHQSVFIKSVFCKMYPTSVSSKLPTYLDGQVHQLVTNTFRFPPCWCLWTLMERHGPWDVINYLKSMTKSFQHLKVPISISKYQEVPPKYPNGCSQVSNKQIQKHKY